MVLRFALISHQVQNFTHQQVTEVRNQLLAIDKELVSASLDKTSPRLQELKREVVLIGNTFLRLEKFVNMNFTGFYKVRAEYYRNSISNKYSVVLCCSDTCGVRMIAPMQSAVLQLDD
jgi:SPX domain protein involved in polyphosphate accumulation